MSLNETWSKIEAQNAADAREATFGHMNAKPGSAHSGSFTFIHGQHGDMCVIESQFDTFGEGPEYFEHRSDFIFHKVVNKGPCAAIGVYHFVGTYHPDNKVDDRFIGTITKLNLS